MDWFFSGLSSLSAAEGLDRSILPIADPTPTVSTTLDVRNATPPPRFVVEPPKDAPNVLIVLIDDLGFAGTSAFGGPVSTPTFDQIAGQGLRLYTTEHTR
ncbi:sulfatase-like hydrolase/transferase [Alkalimarinus alittae]|uniref:Sulfatase-like hydrolase/transferase n=1 Tax=Alkalimarinus alittae TaxID=2961619 RepID=A0ABY6N2Z2_9ALTE|nr:sulfatase-like hydrolase/transferase [Alkalimarinus alittae]UZE96364.1 sulfatase-like hydrolase/transferase [Alkalimarinus alittae]